MEEAKTAAENLFPYEEDLTAIFARLAELNALLDMDRPENEIADSTRSMMARRQPRCEVRRDKAGNV